MIISFFQNKYNKKAINDLNDKHAKISNFPEFEFDDGPTLTLVSLNADCKFQNLISPKVLVDKLIEGGLPDSISEVEILVSDVAGDPLLDYGIRLGREFLAYNREITIKIPMNNEGHTLIVPPEYNGGDWQFFLIEQFTTEQLGKNFESLDVQPKSLLYKGKLEEFLKDDQCIITPKEIITSAQRVDISENPYYNS